ncbi:MAG: InlB B-repeat-containing protein, partial [Lachnospiraceae bacterium]|nr:InlB B-repeat-containing protein [Lachnospiraceae bacterium]
MKKQFSVLMSLVLSLVMVLSMAVPGHAAGITPFIPDLDLPAQSFTQTVNGVTVHVDAPEGALLAGTEMRLTPVDTATVQAAVDNAGSVSGTVVAAVDISFYLNGEALEPNEAVAVTMASSAIAAVSNPVVVHIDANADQVSADSGVERVSAGNVQGGVSFSGKKFSVYAVISGEETTDRITYHFLDGNGNPYSFLNRAGQTVTTQIIKNGESLQEIPAPGLIDNQAFNGWYYYNQDTDTWGDLVEFGKTITVTETKDVYIKAHYGNVIYVTFWQYAAGKVVLERRQLAVNENTGKASMVMSSVTVPAPKTTLKFMGWSLVQGTDNSEENGDTPDSRPLLGNGSVDFTEDTNVYPVYYIGRWIVFVSAGTGMGADYVESYFLEAGSSTAEAARPADPTMAGYAFDGWYTVPDPDY